MTDPKKIPYLLKLLDDESEEVQKTILKELASFGNLLDQELEKLPDADKELKQRVHDLLGEYYRNRIKELWKGWLDLAEDKERLESALGLISEYQNGMAHPAKLKDALDQLAYEYRENYPEPSAASLAEFLFQVKGLRGAESDYYNPFNSNLVYVIEKKRGLPISLATVYILVGYRLGLRVEGCNFPGHFLARIFLNEKMILVDCFNGGRFMDPAEIDTSIDAPEPIENILQREAEAESIVARFLNNLIHAYQQNEDEKNCQLMIDLLNLLQGSEDGWQA